MHCAAKVGKARCGSEALRQAAAPSGSLPEKLFASPARVPKSSSQPAASRRRLPRSSRSSSGSKHSISRRAAASTASAPAAALRRRLARADTDATHRRNWHTSRRGTTAGSEHWRLHNLGGCYRMYISKVYGSGGSPQAGRLRECLRCPRACHLVPRLLRGTEVAVSARSGSGTSSI